MKRKLFIFIAVLAVMACLLAICASADTIKPSDSNAYGELTTFDEAIGRTDISQNKKDGTVARTVLYDGTNYYTVPTAYLFTKNQYETGGILMQFDFGAINSKLSKSFSKTSVIRCELPADITLMGNGLQSFNGFSEIVEIKLSPSVSFVGDAQYKAFANCKKLVTIDASTLNFNWPNSTFSVFEYCESLQSVILPDAYVKDGKAISYNINYMFHGCTGLTEITNLENLMVNTTAIAEKAFKNCTSLSNISIWDGVTSLGAESFRATAITSIIIPDTVTVLPNHVFADCSKLEKVVLPSNLTSIGNYCFEKNYALTHVWMPNQTSLSFGAEVFGQIGSSRAVSFYFPSASCNITFSSTSVKSDPFMTAYNGGTTDAVIKYSEPLSTRCTVFYGEHSAPATANDCTVDICCERCNTVLSEAFDEHELAVTIVYNDGLCSVGVKTTVCKNSEICTAENATVEAPAIFSAKGYSYKESGSSDGLCGGFGVELEALSEYKSANPDAKISLRMVIVNPKYLDSNAFFDENGYSTASGGVIQIELSELVYSSYDYKVSGFSLDHMQSLELCFAMAVCDNVNGVEILQKQYSDGESSPVKNTYTDKSGLTLSAVTVESVAPDVVAALKEQEN